MNEKSNKLEEKMDALKYSVDLLILLEICKLGATRDQARKVLGSMSNEMFAQVNHLFNDKKKGR